MYEHCSYPTDGFSAWPPLLQFTPEVESGIQAAADITFEPGWDSDPAEWNMEVLADHLLCEAPGLASFLLGLDV